ncbi:MAG: hypothetical protein IJ794_04675, partial [Lachnospiraceae bacterium]|nr:hypothetical protein [Lachnospiraceae bacterium]
IEQKSVSVWIWGKLSAYYFSYFVSIRERKSLTDNYYSRRRDNVKEFESIIKLVAMVDVTKNNSAVTMN